MASSEEKSSPEWARPCVLESGLDWRDWVESRYQDTQMGKQGDSIQPWCTLFLILNPILNNGTIVPCPVQTIASWLAYSFLRRQVSWSGILISFKNFPQFVVIHTVKSFSVVNEAEVDVCLKLPCFLHDPMNVPGSSVHGIFQARILEWVAISFSKWSSQPKDWNHVTCVSSPAL